MKALLDCNVYDQFEKDRASQDRLTALIACGRVEVLMPRVVQTQLAVRARGLPDWLPFRPVLDGAGIVGIAIVGSSVVGAGPVYKAHLGDSQKVQVRDAIIAATADMEADLFVSEDRRCRKRAKQHTKCECLTYSEFVQRLESL